MNEIIVDRPADVYVSDGQQALGVLIGVEPLATDVLAWSPSVFPGLVQTSEYAETIFKTCRPALSGARLAKLVDQRQGRLPAMLVNGVLEKIEIFISEDALIRVVGNNQVMANQLQFVLGLMNQYPDGPLTIRVVPFAAGIHILTISPLYAVRGRGVKVEYLEMLGGALFQQDDALVEAGMQMLRAVALDTQKSQQIIEARLTEHAKA